MQTKHYRAKALAICEAMADVSEQMAEMHSGKEWFKYSMNALRWHQMAYIVRHNVTARMRFFLKNRTMYALYRLESKVNAVNELLKDFKLKASSK